MTNIKEFLNRTELKIIENIDERFNSILNDSIQQLKIFSNKLSSNQSLVQCINELSFYCWRLVEIIIDYSYYIQQKSEDDFYKLSLIETTLLSHIDLLNEFFQRRADLLSQSSSNLIIEFDKEIYKELSRIAMELCNQLSTLSLPNYTIGIIGNT
jgi:hypothetical protein